MIIDSPIISGSQSASGPLNQIGNVQITGSLSVTGAINGSITGSVTSASYATTAEFLDGLDSTSFVFTSSFNTFSGSAAGRITNLEAFSSSLDTTFATDASVTASILVLSQSVQASEAALSSSYAIVSGSYASASSSLSIRTSNLEATSSTLVSASSSFAADSASLSTRLTTDETNITTLTNASASFAVVSSSFATTSGSLSTRVAIIEGQDATTGSNTFTGPQFMSEASNAISFTSTASLYTDGGLRVAKDSFVSGTAYFNNITVYGTSSIQYITSSQVDIGANIITVNTDTPAVRFGGLAVFDSGSTQLTGSMLWDSETNHWVYSNPSGSSYSGGMIMSGPRAASLGTEQGTTFNALMKGQGGDHITSSQMFDDGTTVRIPGNLQVTGSLSGSSAVFSSTLSATNLTAEGSPALGGIISIRQDVTYLAKGNGYSSIASSPSAFDFYGYTGASTYKNFALAFNGLTDNTRRTYTLPDGSGTLALTGDLINYVTLGTNQSISGAKTFSSPLTGSSATFSSQVNSAFKYTWGTATDGTTGQIATDNTNNYFDYKGNLIFRGSAASNTLITFTSAGAATFSSSVTAINAILTSGGTERYLQLSGYNSSYAAIRSNVGFNSTYNNLAILLNVNATESGQGNNTIPSWAINLGGNEGDADSFCILRSPAGSYTFSNLLKISGTGAATFSSSVTALRYISKGSSAYNNDFLSLDIGTPGSYVGLRFGYDGSSYNKGALYFISKSGNGVGDFVFALNNSENSSNVSTSDERMRITSGGNVLIGSSTSKADGAGKLQVTGGIHASTGYYTTGVSQAVNALNTDYVIRAGAYSGLIVIRDNTNGGSAVWLADPNMGFIQIANNMPGSFTISWNGSNTVIRKNSGNVPVNLGIAFYSNEFWS
jgi:hypothetical protein